MRAAAQRIYGDPVAHSLGLQAPRVIRTQSLRQSPIGISRLSIGAEQIGMTPVIPPEDSFILALYLTAVPHHELWSRGRLAVSRGYAASSIRIVNLIDEYSALITCAHESMVFYAPRIALDELADEAGTARIRHFTCQPGVIDPVVAHLVSALLPAFQRPAEASSLFIDHTTLALFTHLHAAYGAGGRPAPYTKGGMTRLQAARAKEFLAAHCADNVSLLDAARACGLSRSHFIRAFRVATGLTPHQWLQRYRVDEAKRQLLKPSVSIAEIASACGFADQSHLTRVFSRVVGDSPASWRRRRG
jgi:AraC family transcriptional regulator